MSDDTQQQAKIDASGYTGSVFGGTLWMLIGAAVLFKRGAVPLAIGWLVGFLVSVAWGVWLWKRRTGWNRRGLLYRLIGGLAVVTTMLFAGAVLAGEGAFLHLTAADGHSGWLTLLVFPAVAIILGRVHRDR